MDDTRAIFHSRRLAWSNAFLVSVKKTNHRGHRETGRLMAKNRLKHPAFAALNNARVPRLVPQGKPCERRGGWHARHGLPQRGQTVALGASRGCEIDKAAAKP